VPPHNLSGYNRFTFDFYFNPAFRTKGSFKAKVFASDGIDANASIPEEGERDGDFIKVAVSIGFSPTGAEITDITLGLIGYQTDYKGPVFFDNFAFKASGGEEAYPAITKAPLSPAPLKLEALSFASSVKLVGGKASPATARLYAYLGAIGKSDNVIYGHQNDTHHRRGQSIRVLPSPIPKTSQALSQALSVLIRCLLLRMSIRVACLRTTLIRCVVLHELPLMRRMKVRLSFRLFMTFL
jgi:hypothetical protein